MIALYAWGTPNGKKIPIMLEEVSLPYELVRVDISKGEQKTPQYLSMNPNGKIPVLVHEDAPGGKVTVFESGAILMYLAELTGKLMPKDVAGRYRVIEWLMFQMSAVGPMMGQLGGFLRAEEKVPPAIAKFDGEVKRIFGVLETQLSQCDYLASDYSIADIATYTWVSAYGTLKLSLDEFPHVKAWLDRVGSRPAVVKGLAVFG